MTKAEFIDNFRTARNLYVHGRIRAEHATPADQDLARAAIWLTPKSVAGFDVSDFQEMSESNRAKLEAAVEDFLNAVDASKPGAVPSARNLAAATPPFAELMEMLEPYLFFPDEVSAIEAGLRTLLPLPDWIVNWDFELKPDADDVPAVFLTLYVDETRAPLKDLGKEASILTSKLRSTLLVHGLKRWPYVRFRSVAEHQVG